MSGINFKTISDLKSPSRKKMERAFNAIYREYSYLVFYLSLKIVRNNGAAQEITNETFLRLFENKDKIRRERNIKYWLTTVCKNLSLDYLEKERKTVPIFDDVATSPSDDFASYLDKFRDFLDEEEMELVVLHLLYDYRFREIAEEKGVSVDAVSSKYKRTLEKLKKHYEVTYE